MTTDVCYQHIESTPGVAGGKPRVAGHRIAVEDVAIWHERMGMTPDDISAEYGLTLAGIHAALAFYFDNRADIDRSIEEADAFAAALRASTPSILAERLRSIGRDGTRD